MSLRTRIAATAAVAVALVVVIAAVAIYLGVRAQLLGEIDNSLRDRSAEIAQAVADGPRPRPDGDGGGPPPLDRLPAPPRERFGGRGGIQQLVLPSGRVLRPPGNDDVLPVDARVRQIAARGAGTELTDEQVAGTHLRVYTRGLPGRGAIQVARPLDEVDRQLDRVLLVLLLVGAGGVALGAALAAVVARTALAPIGRFTRRTEELAGNPDPSHRMDAAGSDELGHCRDDLVQADVVRYLAGLRAACQLHDVCHERGQLVQLGDD
ncbi:MAG: two-component system, OmpR family, sensor histidine kinase MprB, partial [Thermoleophilaceae bacterium]|nr:two-component system, OmpR family, sensor histidine kinase MprB [Thermoleophilaceae bacterium]